MGSYRWAYKYDNYSFEWSLCTTRPVVMRLNVRLRVKVSGQSDSNAWGL